MLWVGIVKCNGNDSYWCTLVDCAVCYNVEVIYRFSLFARYMIRIGRIQVRLSEIFILYSLNDNVLTWIENCVLYSGDM